MTSPALLSSLSHLHELLVETTQSISDADAQRPWHPELPTLAWLLGRAVYLETYWLREVIQRDADLTARVRGLFHDAEAWRARPPLPPVDHLVNWALEIQDDNLMRLANPTSLHGPDGEHPLMCEGRLPHWLVQEHARTYETMAEVLWARGREGAEAYQPRVPLVAQSPELAGFIEVSQGHYRIGARSPVGVYDSEFPPQMAEISAYRMALRPVSNAEFLAFMEAGSYQNDELWTPEGWAWLAEAGRSAPPHWRQAEGGFYGVGLQGGFDLAAADPVTGISLHEAQAFARWAGGIAGLGGAVLQHEYQWETAVRTGAVTEQGRVWEWCANPMHAYDGHIPAADGVGAVPPAWFAGDRQSLRGGSLYTQPALRRSTYRDCALPGSDHRFTGARLVLPPT